MKRMLLLGIAALVVVGLSSESFAGHRRFYGGRGVRIANYYSPYNAPNVPYDLYTAPPFQYRGYSGGYGWGGPYPTWHDTSHFDYHPGYVVPHGNHLDFVPGHYDFHPSGHYHP